MNLLQDLNVERFPHLRGSARDHLIGVHDLLASWGNSRDVCLGGLFHNIYGTEIFKPVAVGLGQRARIRKVIGAEAEELAFLFCVTKRVCFFDAHPDPSQPILWDDVNKRNITITGARLAALIEIEIANGVEQFDPALPMPPEQLEQLLQMAQWMRAQGNALMSPAARAALCDVIAALDGKKGEGLTSLPDRVQVDITPLFGSAHHPVMIAPRGPAGLAALSDYVRTNDATLQQLLRDHGAVLLRGFGIASVDDFASAAAALGGQPFAYVGGNTPRTQLSEHVFTSTEYPASEAISLHHEMSYLPQWPRRLFFHCGLAATSGGQTSLANSADVTAAIAPQVIETFRSRRINYIRNFDAKARFGKTWQATYMTEDRDQAAEIIASQGGVARWLPDGGLRVSTICDALLTDPDSGLSLWFNQAEQWHPSALHPEVRALYEQSFGIGQLAHHCEHGDGSPIDETMLAQVRSALTASKLCFDWRNTDVLMLDNTKMMHGREPYQGARKINAYVSRA